MSDDRPERAPKLVTIGIAPDVHKQLLRIQHERRMAEEKLSLSDIIARALAGQPVQP